MQLSLPWRFGQAKPFGSIPQINWHHPLAQGLVFCGYDQSGMIIDLVGGRPMKSVGTKDSVISSAWGSGLNYNLDGSKYFTSDAALRASYTTISFACAYVQTGTVGSYASPFMRSANNNATTPYTNFVVNLNPAAAGQNTVSIGYSLTGPAVAQSANWTGNANNVFTTILGTVDTGYKFYAQGILRDSASGAYVPFNTQDSVVFSGVSDAAATNPFAGFVYYGAFWNRVLSASEAVQLHQDPYCFLWYPEDDIFAELVGLAALSVSQIPVFQIANPSGWWKTDLEGY